MANVLSLVSYKIFPAKLGGQKGIALFNKYLAAFHKFICVTVNANDPSYASYQVLNILSDSKYRYINAFYFFTIKRIIKKHHISHLIIEHPYYGWMAVWLKRFCKIKLIVHSHNIEALRFKSVGKWWWRILWRYEKYIHHKADHSFCINEEDRQYMISRFHLKPQKCSVITYGIEWNYPPNMKEKFEAKLILRNKYALSQNTILYLFNGTLDYLPNLTAVKNILKHINPVIQSFDINYKIIICGKNLPAEMNELHDYADKNIIYAGFVNDITTYFKGVDIFINPLTDGGGIKTKLVEALGYNLNAVSTVNGAIGVDAELCNGKLLLVDDNDWKLFATKMLEAIVISAKIPAKYFDHFYWQNITKKAASIIENLK